MRTTNRYMTVAEYRQLAEEIARQIASEERSRKRKPPQHEVLEFQLIPDPIMDEDYG